MAKLSNAILRETIEQHGLGYMVQDYCHSDQILDPVLAVLWDEATRSLREITEYLETADDDLMEELGSEDTDDEYLQNFDDEE